MKASTTVDFSNGDTVTSLKLDQIIGGFSLESDSVDGQTITLNTGVLSLGVVAEANYGATSIPTIAYKDLSVTAAKLAPDAVETAKIKDLNVTGAKIAADTIGYAKTLPADRAVQADMQSETGSHFVSPDVLKYLPGVFKSYCVVTMATGALSGAYKATGTASGSATVRTITLGVTMANTNYTPIITPINAGGTTGNEAVVTARTTTTITINGGADAYGVGILGQLA